jgi:Protein of unknown function (DUF1559)
MTAPTFPRLCLAIAALAALAFASTSFAPPLPKGKASASAPAETEEAKPAVDPAKLATDEALLLQNKRNLAASTNNLKQIGLAIHSYHDVHGKLPADVVDKRGKVLLSWRVLLLPYVEQEELYKQFRLDEPWDSKHNRKLLEKMPKVFASPRVALKRKGYTVYQGFSGPEALFHSGKPGRRLADITDGLSNTIMTVEATTAVPWTKPADLPFDSKKRVAKFGKAYGEMPAALLGDGSVRRLLLKNMSEETLKAAITIAGGEILGNDW